MESTLKMKVLYKHPSTVLLKAKPKIFSPINSLSPKRHPMLFIQGKNLSPFVLYVNFRNLEFFVLVYLLQSCGYCSRDRYKTNKAVIYCQELNNDKNRRCLPKHSPKKFNCLCRNVCNLTTPRFPQKYAIRDPK